MHDAAWVAIRDAQPQIRAARPEGADSDVDEVVGSVTGQVALQVRGDGLGDPLGGIDAKGSSLMM